MRVTRVVQLCACFRESYFDLSSFTTKGPLYAGSEPSGILTVLSGLLPGCRQAAIHQQQATCV